MKILSTSLVLIMFSIYSYSQNMTNAKIGEIIESVGDSIQGDTGRWQFYIEDIPFICVTDSLNNRMRIISPILETIQLTEELKNASLTANFHTALDVKYAIANDLLWSVFIHPLKELSNHQVKDAIAQVYSANRSFGTTFSSTNLIFPGATKEPKNITEDKKKLKKEKF